MSPRAAIVAFTFILLATTAARPQMMAPAPVQKWIVAATVLDGEGKKLDYFLYREAGPWPTQEACADFVRHDEALDEETSDLLDESVAKHGSASVGLSCIIDPVG